MKKCEHCGKDAPYGGKFCSEKCWRAYYDAHPPKKLRTRRTTCDFMSDAQRQDMRDSGRGHLL